MKLPLALALFGLAACAPATQTPADAAMEMSSSPIAPLARSSVAETIPVAFTGHWDASTDACANGSELRLIVTPSRMQFYESSGSVETVSMSGPGDVTVSLSMVGEGEKWQRSLRMVLSDNGTTLTIDDGTGGVRTRCP